MVRLAIWDTPLRNTVWMPKFRSVGFKVTLVPMAVMFTTCGLVGSVS